MPQRVLIVDDNDADVFICKRSLRRAAPGLLEVLVAKNGEEALDAMRIRRADGTSPDIVLLDINMPRMSGFEFLEALEASNDNLGELRVFLLTSSADERDHERAADFRAVHGYLVKPPTSERLRIALDLASGA